MIISHSRRFILVKSRKTASTSIERAIIPQLGRARRLHADLNSAAGWPAITTACGRSICLTAKWEALSRPRRPRQRVPLPLLLRSHAARPHPPHAAATQFAAYRKYAFDRNPWDFMVSYLFLPPPQGRRRAAGTSTASFMSIRSSPTGTSTPSMAGSLPTACSASRICGCALRDIATETGLNLSDLPRDKGSYRSGADYRSFYSASSRDVVAATLGQDHRPAAI